MIVLMNFNMGRNDHGQRNNQITTVRFHALLTHLQFICILYALCTILQICKLYINIYISEIRDLQLLHTTRDSLK